MLHLLRLLPRNLLSYITGVFARIYFPGWLAWLPCGAFVRLFNIDMREASKPCHAYRSIEEVFTRTLAPGSRTIESNICSPADGVVTAHGKFIAGNAIQVKGIMYSLHELIGDVDSENPISERGWYQTIYLAPHNYHRVHSPVDGELLELKYIPGTLWPVNRQSTEHIPSLFSVNERLVFKIKTKTGMVFVTMVGAFNVGRIYATAFPEWTTNDYAGLKNPVVRTHNFTPGHKITAGEDMGVFMLGSTVVTAFDNGYDESAFREYSWRQPIQVGRSLLIKKEN